MYTDLKSRKAAFERHILLTDLDYYKTALLPVHPFDLLIRSRKHLYDF